MDECLHESAVIGMDLARPGSQEHSAMVVYCPTCKYIIE
jgi:hypothetical protein